MPLTFGMLPRRGTPISYVGNNTAAASTVTIPTHQTGDLIIIFAANSAASTQPTIPGGWTSVTTFATVGAFGTSCGYKIAASGSETSGTWTNADRMAVIVYRGVLGVGNTASDGNNVAGVTMTYPAVTFAVGNGSSWACTLGLTKGVVSPGVPAGTTSRLSATTANLSDTNAGVTGWSATNVTIGSALWATVVLELKD